MTNSRDIVFLGFLTATASAIYIVESMIMRSLPLPFLRLGLANIVALYLVCKRNIPQAYLLTITKTLLGSIATFTLMSPSVLLSLGGGVIAVSAMSLGLLVRPSFSITGISILGAVSHNMAQLLLARYLIIRSDSLFVLTPILILFGLVSGIVTAYISYIILQRIPALKADI